MMIVKVSGQRWQRVAISVEEDDGLKISIISLSSGSRAQHLFQCRFHSVYFSALFSSALSHWCSYTKSRNTKTRHRRRQFITSMGSSNDNSWLLIVSLCHSLWRGCGE